MQVAIAVAAGVLLFGCIGMAAQDGPSAVPSKPGPALARLDIASDGVDVVLPSSQLTPSATFGTQVSGASPMPSATKYTHTMFDP